MSIYLRWGGAILLMIGALYISREYEKYLNRRVAEYNGLAELISHAAGMIARFLAHGGDLWRDFENASLEKCGLLPALRRGACLADAFDECQGKMSLSAEEKQRWSAELHKLGRGYKDGELAMLSDLGQAISAEAGAEAESAEKNVKVARALLLGGALTVVIIII